MTASSTPSEIWSATLSGWPSVTDSEVNRYSFSASGWFIGERVAAAVHAARRSSALLVAPVVIDHERHALEAVALAQPVLEEEAVVARQEPLVGDLDREARRARLELSHVEEAHPPPAHRRGLARGLEVGQEAVELGRRDARARAVGEVERLRHQPLHPAARLGGYRDHLGPQAQPLERARRGVLEVGAGHVPLVQGDDRGRAAPHRDLGDPEVLAREAL